MKGINWDGLTVMPQHEFRMNVLGFDMCTQVLIDDKNKELYVCGHNKISQHHFQPRSFNNDFTNTNDNFTTNDILHTAQRVDPNKKYVVVKINPYPNLVITENVLNGMNNKGYDLYEFDTTTKVAIFRKTGRR